jgi:hypothetical protein
MISLRCVALAGQNGGEKLGFGKGRNLDADAEVVRRTNGGDIGKNPNRLLGARCISRSVLKNAAFALRLGDRGRQTVFPYRRLI